MRFAAELTETAESSARRFSRWRSASEVEISNFVPWNLPTLLSDFTSVIRSRVVGMPSFTEEDFIAP